MLAVCLAPALVHAEPVEPADPVATWLGNDEVFGTIGPWWYWGAGLAVRRELGAHVELGLEGQVLRVDAQEDGDPRHGFALRAGATLELPVARTEWRTVDFRLAPQLAAASEVFSGLADRRTATELAVGLRASFRKVIRADVDDGHARGIGGHITARLTRAGGELGCQILLGYDWGL